MCMKREMRKHRQKTNEESTKSFHINEKHSANINGPQSVAFNQLSIYVCSQEDGSVSESRREKDRLERKRGASVEASKESGNAKKSDRKKVKTTSK